MLPLKLLPSFWQRLLDRDSVPSPVLVIAIAVAARQAETTWLVWGDLDLRRAWLMIVPLHKIKMRQPSIVNRYPTRRSTCLTGPGQGPQREPCVSLAGQFPHGVPHPVEPYASP